jgi:hypothetical protein
VFITDNMECIIFCSSIIISLLQEKVQSPDTRSVCVCVCVCVYEHVCVCVCRAHMDSRESLE